MTCTHVVASALGREQAEASALVGAELWIRLPVDIPCEVRMRVATALPVRPEHSDLAGHQFLYDICVLECVTQGFPPEAVVASPAPQPAEARVELDGSGVTEQNPDGVTINCSTGQAGSYGRVPIVSPQLDLSVAEGCSGAPLYHGLNGLAGMVAEAERRVSGRMIPVRFLQKVRPFVGRRDAAARSGKTAQAAVPVRNLLRNQLEFFDRAPQTGDFAIEFGKAREERSGLVCTLAGIDDDMRDLCRDRLVRDAFTAVGRADLYEDADFLELSIPRAAELDAERALARLQHELKRFLEAKSLASGEIGPALDLPAPLIAQSWLDEADLEKRRNRALVRRWAAWVAALTGDTLRRPFVHFLIIRMRDSQGTGGTRTGLDERMARYERLIASLRRGDAPVRDISLLEGFTPDQIVTWIRRVGAENGLDAELVETVKSAARDRFSEMPYPLLTDVDQWIRSLSLEGKQA